MQSKDNIRISSFSPNQRDIIFKILVFQKMCPDKFLLQDPWPHEELDEEVLEELKYALNRLMPLDSIVIDMWDWDIHFENRTFEDTYFDVAIGPEEYAIAQARFLQEDMLTWIEEFNMEYAQYELGEEFADWVYEQCVGFIKDWRSNIIKAVTT